MIGSTRTEQQWLERIEGNRDCQSRLERALARKPHLAVGNRTPDAVSEDGDRAELMTEVITSQALLRVLAENRDEIERALERLEDGRYGMCEDCGARIEEDRLRFRPQSTRCVTCQRAAGG